MPFVVIWPSGYQETLDVDVFFRRYADYALARVYYCAPQSHVSVRIQPIYSANEIATDLQLQCLSRNGMYEIHGSVSGITTQGYGPSTKQALRDFLLKIENEHVPVQPEDSRIPEHPCPRCKKSDWSIYARDPAVPAWCATCGWTASFFG